MSHEDLHPYRPTPIQTYCTPCVHPYRPVLIVTLRKSDLYEYEYSTRTVIGDSTRYYCKDYYRTVPRTDRAGADSTSVAESKE